MPNAVVQDSIGTLSVNLDEIGLEGKTKDQGVSNSKFAKKPSGSSKKLGVKKLSSSNDDRLESFEAVEKRTVQILQENEDHKFAVKIQQDMNRSQQSSGRVAAAFEQTESVYRSTKPESTLPPFSQRSANNSSKLPPTTESFAARERYANVKGISSDQYFSGDSSENSELKAKLEKFSGSTAISSDMLYHDGKPPEASNSGIGDVDLSQEISKLKDTVKDFFDDIQRRIR